jgi:alpha-beta hydrolase superfamily lysophospholipase
MDTTTDTFTGADGIEIFRYRWAPSPADDGSVAPIRGVVQIAHGLAEHAARYEGVAQALTDAGYLVYAHDHRGHGRSVTREDDYLFFAELDGWHKLVADMHTLTRSIRAAHPETPIVLLGHSMGSFAAQHCMGEYGPDYAAVALSGTTNGPPTFLRKAGTLVAKLARWRTGPRGRSALLYKMSFGPYNARIKHPRTDSDWLSGDPEVVDAYLADPRCGGSPTNQLWLDIMQGFEVITSPRTRAKIPKDLPIYVFAGDMDPVGEYGKSVRALLNAYAELGLTGVRHRLYEGGRHEMLNETNKDEVIAALIEWLHATIPVAT